jgi:hypothetical protein
MTTLSRPKIAVIGGTGALGGALAIRWAKAGYPVSLGSRNLEKARESLVVTNRDHGIAMTALSNHDAAQGSEIVVMTVPWAAHAQTLAEIRSAVQGKVFIDTTVPLVPPKVMRVQLPPAGCAALTTQQLLGEGVQVVAAFHNVAAHKLAQAAPVDCDVLVFGDQKAARDRAIALAEAAGLRGLHAGALANSAAAEALTSVLIFLNKHYAVDGAGIRITGELTSPDTA